MSPLERPREVSPQKVQEKQVLHILEEKLIKFWWFEKNEIKVVRIEPNLFSVGTEKNISFYCDEKWKIAFNIGYIRKQPFFQSFLSTAGFSEMKNTAGEYKLSRVNRNSSTSVGDVQGKDISLYSKEYFFAWEDTEFYRNRFTIDVFRRQDVNKNYHSLSDGKIQNLFNAKSLRVRDFISFLEHKQITQETYDRYIQKLIEQLPRQIGDLRLNKIDDIVTLEEIQDYLERKIISRGKFILFSKRIKSRDELIGNKELTEDEVKKRTLSETGILKQSLPRK